MEHHDSANLMPAYLIAQQTAAFPRCRRTFCNRHCAEMVRLSPDRVTADPMGLKSRVCESCKDAYDAAMRGAADSEFMLNRIGRRFYRL